MSGLVRILTAVVLTAHLTVGCCWHHAHACDNSGHSSPVQGAAIADGQCPESSHSGAGTDHANHGPQDCQGGKCSVTAQRPNSGNWLARPSDPLISPLPISVLSTVGDDYRCDSFFSVAGWLPLPVRLHLVNQVLLI